MIDFIENSIKEKTALKKLASGLIAARRDTVMINETEADDLEIPQSSSKIGGIPSLPPSMSWPRIKQHPIPFLMQINLDQFSTFDKLKYLPPTGILFIFYANCDFLIEKGIEKSYTSFGDVQILYVNDYVKTAKNIEAPNDLDQKYKLKSFRIDFENKYYYPRDIASFKMNKDQEWIYEEEIGWRQYYPRGRSYMYWYWKNTVAYELDKNMILLFSSNNMSKFGMQTGRSGELHLSIKIEDLRSNQFSKILGEEY